MVLKSVRAAVPVATIALGSIFVIALVGTLPASPVIVAFAIALAFSLMLPLPEEWRTDMIDIGRTAARCAVALMGVRLSIPQVATLGATALPLVLSCVGLTFFGTLWLARLLRVPRSLAILIGAATAVCGASAAVAVSSACNSRRAETTYAIATATILGSVAMLALPAFGSFFHLDPKAYGLLAGTALHEVAHVLGATDAGSVAREVATVTKITRILCLPIIMIVCTVMTAREQGSRQRIKIWSVLPSFLIWFVLGSVCASLELSLNQLSAQPIGS